MTEPLPELERALQQVAAPWDDARTARTLTATKRKRAARRQRAWLAAGVAGLCMLGGGGWLVLSIASGPTGVQLAVPGVPKSASLVFADGSRAYAHDANTRLVVARVTSALTEVDLVRGGASFDVTRHPERRFRVLAGDVVVQVLGTAFDVTRSPLATRVAVTRGRVAVSWPGGTTELGVGDARTFPVDPHSAAEIPAAGTQPGARRAQSTAAGSPRARSAPAQGWRQHAERGDFKRAYALLETEHTPVADDVEELLLAADAARLSGHPAQSLGFLRKVIEQHTQDPRAPLASFTLGGVLLNQLGRPDEAEAAYARARVLSPRGSLAQDALARQVEAAHRGGDPARARALALEYLERYPDGRRVQAVRGFGGLP